MNTRRMSEDYMRRARRALAEAETALADGDHAAAVRRAQECVEMGSKGILRALTIEYPSRHDVSHALRTVRDRGDLPEWFRDKVDWLAEVSRDLAEKRGPATYGDEATSTPPSELFDRGDAEEAVSWAREVLKLAQRLLDTANAAPPG